MKSQLSLRKFFAEGMTFILMAMLVFACTTSPQSPGNPVVKPTKTKSSPVSDNQGNNESGTKRFSIQNSNTIRPEDVLEEVSFGGQGAGDVCEDRDFDYPRVDDRWTTPEQEWLGPINVVVCGWWSDDQVEVNIELPNGMAIADSIQVEYTSTSIPFVFYKYSASIDDPVGDYTFSFEGESGYAEHTVRVFDPNEPRMYYLASIQAFYLYGFYSNEEVRLFLYDEHNSDATFKAWERYAVDENGRLAIRANYDEGVYFVVGDLSGPVGRASLIMNESPVSEPEVSSISCSNALPSRLEVGKYAYVSTDPPLDNRVREGAGTNYPIIGYIDTGNPMKILDGPECGDGWTWWKVQSIKKADLVGWTAEGDDTYWLVPCKSVDACHP